MAKGNQPLLEDELNKAIIDTFDQDNPDMQCHRKREINRGREEYREVCVLPCPKNCSVFANWALLQTIGVIYRSREINGVLEESSETFITNLPCKLRDVTSTEDASRIRKGTGPEISSVFRRLALSIFATGHYHGRFNSRQA